MNIRQQKKLFTNCKTLQFLTYILWGKSFLKIWSLRLCFQVICCIHFLKSGDCCMTAQLKSTVSISVFKKLSILKSFINHQSQQQSQLITFLVTELQVTYSKVKRSYESKSLDRPLLAPFHTENSKQQLLNFCCLSPLFSTTAQTSLALN